jgi:ADP-ribose pyrophosphatase YjhB (NUDIX family)
LITFDTGDTRFQYRAGGVIIEHNKVLLLTIDGLGFWFLPGGRVNFLEPAEEALIREIKEELDAEIQSSRLIWIVENFFNLHEKEWHEIGLYFLITLPEGSPLCKAEEFTGIETESEEFSVGEKEIELICKWYSLNELDNVNLKPSFLIDALKHIPDNIEHIVHIDR